MKPTTRLSLIYWLISALHVTAVALTTMGISGLMPMDYITKVLLMPALMAFWYFAVGDRIPKMKKLMLTALFFSWVGDVVLMVAGMLPDKNAQMIPFLGGLVAFLITHLCYITYFRKEFKAGGQPPVIRQRPTLVFPVLVLAGILLYMVLPKLPLIMQLAVGLYSTVLAIMVVSALNRMNQVPRISYLFTYMGAQLFMVSDGMIAYNAFYEPQKWGGVFIMVTYIAGQYFIVQGVLKAVDYYDTKNGIYS